MTVISIRWIGMSLDISSLSIEKKLVIEMHSVKIRRQIKGKMRADMGGVQSVNVFFNIRNILQFGLFCCKDITGTTTLLQSLTSKPKQLWKFAQTLSPTLFRQSVHPNCLLKEH